MRTRSDGQALLRWRLCVAALAFAVLAPAACSESDPGVPTESDHRVGSGDVGPALDAVVPDGSGDLAFLHPIYRELGGGCGPGTCSGCCSGGACVITPTESACGKGGGPCQTCQPDETCQSGSCVTSSTCGPGTCAGCCNASGGCQPGTDNAVCGKGGAACTACGSGQSCLGQACAGGAYKLKLVSAKVTDMGAACGMLEFGECDLLVYVEVGTATAVSSTQVDTNSPVWNEVLLTSSEADLLQGISVEVRDDDFLDYGVVGACTLKPTSADLTAGAAVIDCGEAKKLTFAFIKV